MNANMNQNMLRSFRPTALAVALALACGNAGAQEQALQQEDENQRLIKPASSISFGIGNNLGLDTRWFSGEWLRQGDLGASIEYSRLTPHDPLTYLTGLQGIGTSTQVISGAGVNVVPSSEISLGTTSDRTKLGFFRSFFGNAGAQEDELQRLIKPASSISVGIGNWSDDRHQRGIHDGMREGRAYGLLDLDLVRRHEDSGTWLTLTGRNLGLDTRWFRGEWLRQGDIGASIEYSRLTRDDPLTYLTGLQGIGTSTQVISGAGVNALPSREIRLGTTRDRTKLGFFKSFSSTTELRITLGNEEKDGARHWSIGSAALFVTEPIDSTTNSLEAVLNSTWKRLQLSGGYRASWYDNRNSLVSARVHGVTDSIAGPNPASPTPLSLPLDNQAHQIYLHGGYSLGNTTRATFKLSYGRATQDELLPVAFNVIPFALMPARLDGRVDTTIAELGLTSSPLPKLRLTANLRYHDFDDKTPVLGYIGTTVPPFTPTVFNTPHSFKTTSGKLEGTYRLPGGFSLRGGVDYREQDRSAPTLGTAFVPFRTKIEETTYRLQLTRSLSETLNGSLAYLHSERDGAGEVPASPGAGFAWQRAMNPLNISDRTRDRWRGMLDWSPTDRFSMQFSLEDARDAHDFRPPETALAADQAQGRKDGSANMYAMDASYTFNEFWQVHAWYSRDVTKAHDLAFQQSPAAQKVIDLEETGDAFGLGFKGQQSAKLSLGANFEWSKTVSEFDQMVGAAAMPMPDINNRLTLLRMFVQYAINDQSGLRFDVIHERARSDDWAWTFAAGDPFVYGLTTDGTMVTFEPRENSTFIGVRYQYKF